MLDKICFGAGTMVATSSGLKAIEQIEVGELVWSRDEATGESGWKSVTHTFESTNREVLELTFSGGNGSIEVLRITAEHPLWSIDSGEWRLAGALVVGEKVDALGGAMKLMSIVESESLETVYNLEVADSHTYFVGEAGIWAHNICTIYDAIGRQAGQTAKDIVTGKVPLSSLSPALRQQAANWYRAVAEVTKGAKAADARAYNIARAEFLEGTRATLPRTLPDWIALGGK